MNDEKKKVDKALRELDPKRAHGEELAEKIAEDACTKIENIDYTPNITDEEGREKVKDAIKESVKENL